MIALAIIVVVLPLAPAFAAALHRPRAAARGGGSGLRTGDAWRRGRARDQRQRRPPRARAQRLYLRRRAERLLSGDDRAGRRAGQLRIGRVPARRGGARRAAAAPSAALLHLLRDLRVDDARLVRDRQPRTAVGPDRGEHARELRAGRPRGQVGLARSRVEVHHHQLVRGHDRAGRDAVSVLRRGQPAGLADRAPDLVLPVRARPGVGRREPAAGVPASADRLRDEGRAGADAHLASRRALGGSRAPPARCSRPRC